MRTLDETIELGAQSYTAAEHFPALIYPNPLNPSKYVVLNSGLTIDEREYQAAILKVKDGAEVPDVVVAGLFDESWRAPR